MRPAAWRGAAREYAGLGLVVLVLVATFGLATEHFFTAATFRTIANQIPAALVVAVGMTFVLVVASIDLSVGSVLALSGAVLGAGLVDLRMGLPLALAACLLTGLACGALSGLVVVRWGIPSFIVTLGMMEMARGGAYLVTGSRTRYIGPAVERIADASVLGLSLPFAAALLVVGLGQVVLSRTVFGRTMVAVGTSEEAVRLSGIDTGAVKAAVFVVSGLLAALGAVLHSARLGSADPNAGAGFELQAIAAVVIGGTSLLGGRGSVVSSFFGVVIMAVLGTGLAQVGVQDPSKRLITGVVIVAAVIADRYRHRGRVREA
jgi:ribose transport system permease protein